MTESAHNEDKEKVSRKFFNESMDRYRVELENDLKINFSNIQEKAMSTSALRCKWLNYYTHEKENLSRLKKAKEKYLKKKMPSAQTSILALKSQDRISENDDTMKKINDLTESTKEVLDYLQQVLDIMSDFGFTIKNAIDQYKLERM